MIPASRLLGIVHRSTRDSGFGSLLPADLTYHHSPPTHPRTASSITHRNAAGPVHRLARAASPCRQKETT